MAETSKNTCVETNKGKKPKKERVWTETELKYFAIVLADEKKQYAVRLETLALKKSANNLIFEDIANDFESLLKSDDFIEENEREKEKWKRKRKDTAIEITAARLRVKYKFLRNQWRKFTDRVKKGSGKAPIDEPEWFSILNPIFSDSMGEMSVSSCSDDILLPHDPDSSSESDKETDHISITDRSDTPTSSAFGELENSDDDILGTNTNSSSSSTKRKQKPKLESKPCFQKRVKSQSQAIQNIAKSFTALGEIQEKRSQLFTEAEKERQAEFLSFQREQAELNRQHELKMMEMMMRFTRNNPPPLVNQVPQQQTHNMYPYNGLNMIQYQFDQSQAPTTQGACTLTGLESPASGSWYEHK